MAPTPGQAAPSTTMFCVTTGGADDAIRSAAEALIAKIERKTSPIIFFMTANSCVEADKGGFCALAPVSIAHSKE